MGIVELMLWAREPESFLSAYITQCPFGSCSLDYYSCSHFCKMLKLLGFLAADVYMIC